MTVRLCPRRTAGDARAEATALVGGKAANLGVDGPRPRPAGAARVRDHDRAPAGRSSPAAGRPGSTTSSGRRWPSVEARSGGGSATPADPLLVSVRSGAPVSMPGMMDTILNLGLNDATDARARRAAPATRRSPRDCRERLRASFRSIVGVDDVPDDPWRQLRLAIEAVFRSWNERPRAAAYRREGGDPRRPRDRP